MGNGRRKLMKEHATEDYRWRGLERYKRKVTESREWVKKEA